MHDILAEEVVRYVDSFWKDRVQNEHSGFGLDAHPLHVTVFEVVEDGDAVAVEDGQVPVQILALEGVRDDGLVLDTDQVVQTVGAQGADRPFELPGGGVGGWE